MPPEAERRQDLIPDAGPSAGAGVGAAAGAVGGTVPADGDRVTVLERESVTRLYAWTVFALLFGLLLSDYMSRQVLAAVFPLLKADWRLTDTQLGALGGVVALMVGILTVPLSLLADRWGRVRSIAIMAVLWSLATLICGVAQNYTQMFVGRLFVGVGEAAYGSVGVALAVSVFPRSMRATITGAFMAGGVFGSVLGMALGGAVGATLGWRTAFTAIAVFGLVLAVLFPLVVRERIVEPDLAERRSRKDLKPFTLARAGELVRQLFGAPAASFAYVGSALQLMVTAAMLAWMTSFLQRYYHLPEAKSAGGAAILVLICGVGTIVCGAIADRMSLTMGRRKASLAAAYSVISLVLFVSAFLCSPGAPQLVLIGAAMFFVAGICGPAGAVAADLTPPAIHGTTFAVLTLINNLLGLAPGPILAGIIADRAGLGAGLATVSCASVLAAGAFVLSRRFYDRDLEKRESAAA
jgi:MFS family permease